MTEPGRVQHILSHKCDMNPRQIWNTYVDKRLNNLQRPPSYFWENSVNDVCIKLWKYMMIKQCIPYFDIYSIFGPSRSSYRCKLEFQQSFRCRLAYPRISQQFCPRTPPSIPPLALPPFSRYKLAFRFIGSLRFLSRRKLELGPHFFPHFHLLSLRLWWFILPRLGPIGWDFYLFGLCQQLQPLSWWHVHKSLSVPPSPQWLQRRILFFVWEAWLALFDLECKSCFLVGEFIWIQGLQPLSRVSVLLINVISGFRNKKRKEYGKLLAEI